jgi:hypothetical protein
MRKLIFLVLFAALPLSALASKPLTVSQLEQKLGDAVAAHRSDSEIAKKIGNLSLSERLTTITQDRLIAKLSPGPLSKLSLQLLADQSAFLDPPTSELPATVAPDAETQARLLTLARGYVVETLSRLPNLFATRTTYHFDDSPQVLKVNEWPVRAGLHLVGNSSHEITYRDGREIVNPLNPASPGNAQNGPESGLQGSGEFGPDLAVVMTDSASGQIAWSHWEQGAYGPLAVFRYSVPKHASHYSVHYCCIRDASAQSASSRGGRRGGRTNMPTAEDSHPFNATPAYHGSIAVDPASGSILRISIEPELGIGDPLNKAASVVEYGPVVLGNRRSICPLSSLTLTEEHIDSMNPVTNTNPIRVLNETTFTHYQRLGTTVRVIPNAAESAVPTPAQAPPSTPTSASPASPEPANSVPTN